MKHISGRTASALAALCVAALSLGACSSEGAGDSASGSTAAESAAVSANPKAPKLTEAQGTFNFLHTEDDGSMRTLVSLKVLGADGWLGLKEEKGQFTILESGKYKVVARGSAGCSGVGSESSDGLGTIGEVHVETKDKADIWSTPAEIDADELYTIELVDADNNVVSCAKSVKWTPPTESESSS